MNIVTQLVEFILFKRDVKDIAYNPSIAALLFSTYVILVCLIFEVLNQALVNMPDSPVSHFPLLRPVAQALIFVGLFYCLFAAQQKQSRFVQAATAFYGSASALLVAVILVLGVPQLALMIFGLLGWYCICLVRVTIQSLDYSVMRAVLALLGLGFASSFVADLIFPLTYNEAFLDIQKAAE